METRELITKEKLTKWLHAGTPTKTPAQVVGWAINAIYEQQDGDEKSGGHTLYHNGRGFTQADARVGSVTARQYIQYGSISPRLYNHWVANGGKRLLKYSNQLNKIALNKQRNENNYRDVDRAGVRT